MRPDLSYIYKKAEKTIIRLSEFTDKDLENFVVGLEEFVEAANDYNIYYKENKHLIKKPNFYNESDYSLADDTIMMDLNDLELRAIEKLERLQELNYYNTFYHILRQKEKNLIAEWEERKRIKSEFLF